MFGRQSIVTGLLLAVSIVRVIGQAQPMPPMPGMPGMKPGFAGQAISQLPPAIESGFLRNYLLCNQGDSGVRLIRDQAVGS